MNLLGLNFGHDAATVIRKGRVQAVSASNGWFHRAVPARTQREL